MSLTEKFPHLPRFVGVTLLAKAVGTTRQTIHNTVNAGTPPVAPFGILNPGTGRECLIYREEDKNAAAKLITQKDLP